MKLACARPVLGEGAALSEAMLTLYVRALYVRALYVRALYVRALYVRALYVRAQQVRADGMSFRRHDVRAVRSEFAIRDRQ